MTKKPKPLWTKYPAGAHLEAFCGALRVDVALIPHNTHPDYVINVKHHNGGVLVCDVLGKRYKSRQAACEAAELWLAREVRQLNQWLP